MRVLESAPSRYDRGIRMITLGKIPALYRELTNPLTESDQVLDIGCGTGLISLLAAQKGSKVKGIDKNPEVLAIARKRIEETGLQTKWSIEEKGIAELDTEADEFYDFIFAGLVFSELEEFEQDFALMQIVKLLKPEGTFVLVDEISASSFAARIIQRIIRFPLVLLTYLLTQTTTSSVKCIEKRLESSGLMVEKREYFMMSSLGYFICRKGD